MKRLFSSEKPEHVVEVWEGQFRIFCWLDYLFTLPRPTSLITTRKENGLPNACLDASSVMLGGGEEYSVLVAVYLHYHTYANILREKEWCLNFPGAHLDDLCYQTVLGNGPEVDEITAAGLTVEPAQTVKAPRIAECLVNLECRLEWDRPLYEGSNMHLFCGRVSALAVDDSLLSLNGDDRLRAMNPSFFEQGQINPLTGKLLNGSTNRSFFGK